MLIFEKGQTPNTMQMIANFLGASVIPIAIWGLIITIPKTGDGFGGKLDCSQALFFTGFACAVIPWIFIAGYLGYYGYKSYKKKQDGGKLASEGGGVPVGQPL